MTVAQVLLLAGTIVAALWAKLLATEKQRDTWQERWAREVRRGAGLAVRPSSGEVPPTLPPPDWDEPSVVRNMRAELERAELDRMLSGFDPYESTPPRKSRP